MDKATWANWTAIKKCSLNTILTAAHTACLSSLNICRSLNDIHADSIIRVATIRRILQLKHTFATQCEVWVFLLLFHDIWSTVRAFSGMYMYDHTLFYACESPDQTSATIRLSTWWLQMAISSGVCIGMYGLTHSNKSKNATCKIFLL